eukprot:COSAG02_NODE_5607_length_4191_cov_10.523776_3_plen_75_part_00
MNEAVLREAERRCAEDALAEQRAYGVLPPCRSIDPLWPPLSLAEYVPVRTSFQSTAIASCTSYSPLTKRLSEQV